MSAEEFDAQETTAKFDVAELVKGWHAYEDRQPNVVPVIKLAAKSDMGQVRENNEDKFDFYEPELPSLLACRGCLYAVADGVGGAQAGQIASEMMLKNLISAYYDHPSPDAETALRDAISTANDRVHALGQMILERSGMGTTLTTVIFIEDRVLVGQVGDSRAYLLRQGTITQVTQDHSLVEEQFRAGILSREDADRSPFRNVITRSIGASPSVIPDFFQVESQIGDTWILCSDGLSGYVAAEELAQIAGCNAPSEAARQLVELANSRGGHDNITVLIVSLRNLAKFSPELQGAYSASTPHAFVAAPVSDQVSGNAVSMRPSNPMQANGSDVNGMQLAPSGQEPARSGWRKFFGLS